MATAKTYGVIGVFGVLLASGLFMTLSNEELGVLYVCSTNDKVAACENFAASTNKTCVWIENGTKKSSVCANGIWEPLTVVLSRKNESSPVHSPVMATLFSTEKRCTTVSYPGEALQIFQRTINCSGNCSSFVDNYTGWVPITLNETTCEDILVTVGGNISYTREDRNCWKSDDIFCCLDNKDGGAGAGSRDEQFRKLIRPGECGACINLSSNNSVVSSGDCPFGEVKFS